MNPIIHKIVVPAGAMAGGPKAPFRARELVGTQLFPHHSESRQCIRLERNVVRGAFRWSPPSGAYRPVFRIRGMWDMYRSIAVSFLNTLDLKHRAVFEVRLNDQTLFNGEVQFMNYRKWRFWPAIEMDFDPALLRDGVNTFEIRLDARPLKRLPASSKDIPTSLLNNTAYQISDVQILALDGQPLAPIEPLPKGLLFGHLIGGHEGIHLSEETFTRTIRLFTQEGQGNLIAFLFNSHFVEINPGLIDTESIKRAGLYVAIRNHFNYSRSARHDWPEAEHNRRMQQLIRRLGSRFLGFAPHEQHGQMGASVAALKTTDLARVTREFSRRFEAVMRRCRALAPTAAIWETDPSFYHRYYMEAGTVFPAIEVVAHHIALLAASARGTAKAHGVDRWGAINSWDCQCFGGLSMRSQDARRDPDFEAKRQQLWWTSQFMLYLAGARVLYSESGPFYHRLTVEKEFDHPAVAAIRDVHRDLIAFARRHPISGQPLADWAYLQGRYDIFSLAVNPSLFPAAGPSPLSWKNLEVCYPNYEINPTEGNAVNFRRAYGPRRDSFSDTPAGSADILPVEAPLAAMKPYRLLMMSGWNTMDQAQVTKLERYVRAGGILTVLLPQMTSISRTDLPFEIKSNWLRSLCGVALVPSGPEADAPLNRPVLDSGRRERFPETSRLLERQPPEAQYVGAGTYNVMIRHVRMVSRAAKPLLTDAYARMPFVVEHSLGRGRVYLFALAEFSRWPTVYELINAVTRDIMASVPRAIRLISGRNVNYFVYAGQTPGERFRVFVMRHDWFGAKPQCAATFAIFNRRMTVKLARRHVAVISVRHDRSCKIIPWE